jgi:hypothetical protein
MSRTATELLAKSNCRCATAVDHMNNSHGSIEIIDLCGSGDDAPQETRCTATTHNTVPSQGLLRNETDTLELQDSKRGKKARKARFWKSANSAFHFDNNHVYLEVAGRPRAKKRAASGCLSHRYNPSKQDELEFASVCAAICSENSCTMPLFFPDSALSVHLCFFLPQSTGDETKIFATGDIDNMCNDRKRSACS